LKKKIQKTKSHEKMTWFQKPENALQRANGENENMFVIW
jgi:hypothetical protein